MRAFKVILWYVLAWVSSSRIGGDDDESSYYITRWYSSCSNGDCIGPSKAVHIPLDLTGNTCYVNPLGQEAEFGGFVVWLGPRFWPGSTPPIDYGYYMFYFVWNPFDKSFPFNYTPADCVDGACSCSSIESIRSENWTHDEPCTQYVYDTDGMTCGFTSVYPRTTDCAVGSSVGTSWTQTTNDNTTIEHHHVYCSMAASLLKITPSPTPEPSSAATTFRWSNWLFSLFFAGALLALR